MLQSVGKKLYPGIGARITFPFLLATIVVAGIGVFIVTRLVAGSIQERINNQLVDSAQAASNTVVEIERQQITVLRSIAFTEGIDSAIEARDLTEIDKLLRPIAFNTGVDEVIVFDAGGNSLFQLARPDNFSMDYTSGEVENLAEREGIQRVVRGEVDALGDKQVDIVQTEQGTMFYFNSPILNENKQLVGGVSIGISSNNLIRRVREQALSSISIYSPDGQIIDTTFRTVDPAELILLPEQANELNERVQETNPTEEKIFSLTTYQVLYVPFEIRGIQRGILAVALPKNFIADKIGTSRDALAALFSSLFMGIAVIGIVVSRTISNPVKQLVKTTRAIREGDLSKRVGLVLPDELGELSLSFDHMTDQLVQRNQEISQLYHEQIHETARREAVLSSVTDAMIVFNSALKITLTNQAADTLIQQCKMDVDAYMQFNQLCEDPERLQVPQTISLVNQVFSVLSTPVTLPNEQLLGHVVVFRDITALIKAERLKDEIILQLSHELRTPLTAAKGYLDLVKMLKRAQIDEQGNQFLGQTHDQLGILERMINQVIDVSTMIAGNFHVALEKCELSEIIRTAVEENMSLIQQRGHQIMTFLPGGSIWIAGDKGRLIQVVDHLLRNAHSYTSTGGLIEVNAKVRGAYVYVSVHDNGVGIDADEIELVFDCMYRGRSADAGPTDSRGLGLGLFIAKQVVEAHYGQIFIRSQRDYGTTVTFALPLK